MGLFPNSRPIFEFGNLNFRRIERHTRRFAIGATSIEKDTEGNDSVNRCPQAPEQLQTSIEESLELRDVFKHNSAFYRDDLTTYAKNRIRILGINPGTFHDPLHCRLRSLPLRKDNLSYGALSYAWGDKSSWTSIPLDGKPGFKVTASVASALRRLRHPEQTRCLWVDAICVNQANVKERNQQVALMTDIFRYAELVYVWLGPCGILNPSSTQENSDPECCHQHSFEWDGTIDFTKTSSPLFHAHESSKMQWWWRTWAVQEVALARKIAVRIGPHQISWQKALEAFEASWLKTRPGDDAYRIAYQQFLQFNTLRGKRGWLGEHLRYLLQLTARHAASDPRDRVYGILGLLDQKQILDASQRLAPDYGKTYPEVCVDATLHLISDEQNLDVLVEDWPRLSEPSWALDFAKGVRKPPSLLQRGQWSFFDPPRRLGNTLRCHASGDLNLRFEVQGRELVVQGVHFDMVSAMFRNDGEAPDRFTVEPVDLQDSIRRRSMDVVPRDSQEPDNLRTRTLHWLESSAHIVGEKAASPMNANISITDQQEQFARTVSTDWYLRAEHPGQIHPDDFTRYAPAFRRHKRSGLFHESAWNTLKDRALFVTEQGFCGVSGSLEVHVGDIVVVLSGCSMPVVLRPMGSEGGGYRLVGECYVSGIVYGELMETKAVGEMKDFRLA